MRILQIVADLTPANGVSEVVLNLADALDSCDVVIATTLQAENESVRKLKHKGVRVVRFMPCFPHFLCFSWQMMRELGAEAKHADVIHVHGAWSFPVWWGCHLALKHRKPLIRSPHGSFVRRALVKSAVKKKVAAFFLEKRYLSKAAVVHATSLEEAEQLRTYQPKMRSLVFIPNGVKTPARRGLRPEKPRNEVRTALFLGRLHPMKGLDNLIAAWGYLRSSNVLKCERALSREKKDGDVSRQEAKMRSAGGTNRESVLVGESVSSEMKSRNLETSGWNLIIAGPDDGYRSVLEKLVRDHRCSSSITFAGPVDGLEKWELYQDADLFVLPTLSESFGLVVGEALACGVPVITTKGAPWAEVEGMAEWQGSGMAEWQGSGVAGERDGGVSGWQGGREMPREGSSACVAKLAKPDGTTANGRCGWWVEIGVEPLAEALREAMSLTDEERRTMGQHGRRLVETKYRWETVAAKMAAVYSGIVG